MDIKKYKEFLLSAIPTAKLASGGTFINCRCFNCPDSSNPKSKHFYIAIPQAEDEPSWYYCHKCHCSGLVTHKTLIEWGIYDENIAINLTDHNKKCSTKSKNSKYYDRSVYNLFNSKTIDNNISRIKLNYINNRLGYNFTYEELRKLKIVLNLNDILRQNNITKLTRDINIVNQLDINFLGFISIDNAFLNMRKLCDDGKVYQSIDKRYINYKIFDKFDTSERFYTIPTEIDLNIPERLKIHIAEGPFDILSIYKNLRHEERGIYTSVAGSNYSGLALHFLQMFKLPYVEFHFYPDNDKYGSNDAMNRVANILRPIQAPIYIHRNLYPGEKDFGVSLSNIKESIYMI
jgi:hypothetical protein